LKGHALNLWKWQQWNFGGVIFQIYCEPPAKTDVTLGLAAFGWRNLEGLSKGNAKSA
jgi:hypothetical protein